MKRNIPVTGAAVLLVSLLASCGGSDNGGGSASSGSGTGTGTGSAVMMVDTANVLAQAEQKSETTEAYTVNGGLLVFTDTTDTTEPISIVGP
jgi:hypothetical protein